MRGGAPQFKRYHDGKVNRVPTRVPTIRFSSYCAHWKKNRSAEKREEDAITFRYDDAGVGVFGSRVV